MNGACDQFLASSGLATDQNSRIRGCHDLDIFQRTPKNFTRSDDLVESCFALNLTLQIRCQTLIDGVQQGFTLERFGQEVYCTCFKRAHRHWYVAVTGEEYDRDLNTRFRELLLQVEPRQSGKVHIQDQTTWVFRPGCSQELLACRKRLRHHSGGAYQTCHSFAH
jgi:hypothetical protein